MKRLFWTAVGFALGVFAVSKSRARTQADTHGEHDAAHSSSDSDKDDHQYWSVRALERVSQEVQAASHFISNSIQSKPLIRNSTSSVKKLYEDFRDARKQHEEELDRDYSHSDSHDE